MGEVTAMARGLLMPRLTMEAMDTEAMEVTAMARGPLMPRLTMEATDTEATEATAMARGLQMPRLTMEATDMEATEVMAMASNFTKETKNHSPPKISIPDLNLFSILSNCYELILLEIQYSVEELLK